MELPIGSERAFWDGLEVYARSCAIAVGLQCDDAEDCMRDFVVMKLQQPQNPFEEAHALEGRERLLSSAQQHARQYYYRCRSLHRREVSLEEMKAQQASSRRHELVCPSPGPEALVIQAELLDRLLGAIDGLLPAQQQLWVRYAVDGVALVDLQEELGRTDVALWQALARIRKRLQKVLEGEGITPVEVAEYRSMLSRRPTE